MKGWWVKLMTKVIIKERYKTSFGNIIQVESSDVVKIGDSVIGDDGIVYRIKNIIMPTKPTTDLIGIVY